MSVKLQFVFVQSVHFEVFCECNSTSSRCYLNHYTHYVSASHDCDGGVHGVGALMQSSLCLDDLQTRLDGRPACQQHARHFYIKVSQHTVMHLLISPIVVHGNVN